MQCQLRVLPQAGRELTWWERVLSRARQRGHYIRHVANRLRDDPMLVVGKLRGVLGLAGREVPAETRDSVKSNLGLSPGDSVRIKSREEILATLDEDGRCEGLGYMSSEQDRYCGGTYKVLKRVELFFDERTQKMLKVKNTVLLDKVYCEPELHGDPRIAGCQRMCFLFWKEAWLERVDAEAKGDK